MVLSKGIGHQETMDVIKIYFGHPKDTYDTEYEMRCIEKIKELYSRYSEIVIINPKDIKIAEEDKDLKGKGYTAFIRQMQKYYFPAIQDCNLMVVARTKSGKISPGVQKEIKFAEAKGIRVEYLDSVIFPDDNKHTLICNGCGLQFLPDDSIEYEVDVDGYYQVLCWKCITGER